MNGPFSIVDGTIRMNTGELTLEVREHGIGIVVDRTMVNGVAVPTVLLAIRNDLTALTEVGAQTLAIGLNRAIHYFNPNLKDKHTTIEIDLGAKHEVWLVVSTPFVFDWDNKILPGARLTADEAQAAGERLIELARKARESKQA